MKNQQRPLQMAALTAPLDKPLVKDLQLLLLLI